MKISIIIPVLNDVRIARALKSIFEQQLDHRIETIVVDACSNDGTLDVLKRYADRLDVLIREPDRNLYHGMNKGVQRATGDVVGILNADDQYCDEYVLADVMKIFEHSPEVDVCWGDMVYVDAGARRIRYWKSSENSRYGWYIGWRPPHPGFFLRRYVYQRYGAFNVNLNIAADYELQLRLLFKNHLRSAYLNRALVDMQIGGISNKSIWNIVRANWESYRAWRLNKLWGGQGVPFIKPLRSILQIISCSIWEKGFR